MNMKCQVCKYVQYTIVFDSIDETISIHYINYIHIQNNNYIPFKSETFGPRNNILYITICTT